MKLSIIISNRNDVAMLAVTVRSCIEELRSFHPDDTEIVIGDNSDEQVCQLIKGAIPVGYIQSKKIKMVRQNFPCLFSARELAIETATGEYIVCLDSHMLVGRGMFEDLVIFMENHRDDPTVGFAHAPISWAHQHERNAKHDRDVSVNELGNWNTKYDKEQTITWKGMPWICRRDWFLDRDKGLNGYGVLAAKRISWGGGDMHIGVKPWLLGFKNWAVPTNPGIHIGPFPKVDLGEDRHSVEPSDPMAQNKYRLYSTSGEFPHTFGFLVSCYVLGGESMMERNEKAITERFGKFINVREWWEKAKELGKDEKEWLDERKIMSFEQFLERKPWI
jgi:hypothetical protein